MRRQDTSLTHHFLSLYVCSLGKSREGVFENTYRVLGMYKGLFRSGVPRFSILWHYHVSSILIIHGHSTDIECAHFDEPALGMNSFSVAQPHEKAKPQHPTSPGQISD